MIRFEPDVVIEISPLNEAEAGPKITNFNVNVVVQ
jgi:hypothetical protein